MDPILTPDAAPRRTGVPRRRVALLTGAAVLVVGLSGLAAWILVSRPVQVSPPTDVTGQALRMCDGLAANLPDVVGGVPRRDTTPDSSLSAAWGNPAITLRCGVGRPAALGADDLLTDINGIGWFDEPLTAGHQFTTVGLPAGIEVRVPDTYAPETTALVDLTPAIRAALAGLATG